MERSFRQELTAVFGHPVAENPTQAMVEAAYGHHGMFWRYLTIEVTPGSLPAAIEGARAMGFRGFNLTIPHKVAVMPLVDEIAPSAAKIGAVNCVVNRDGALIGENTDGRGFLESLREVRDPTGVEVLLFGAGGAARAVAVELAAAGASAIHVANRTPSRGEELVRHLRDALGVVAHTVPWNQEIAVPRGVEVVVNCTSLGLYPDVRHTPPLNVDSLDPAMVVADVIPNPPQTPFLRNAAARGCRTLDGLGMLINQGRIGIRLWSGVDPDPRVMRSALEEIFQPPV